MCPSSSHLDTRHPQVNTALLLLCNKGAVLQESVISCLMLTFLAAHAPGAVSVSVNYMELGIIMGLQFRFLINSCQFYS